MAYKDDYYAEVDNILDDMRKDNPYEPANDINAVRYEDQGQIQPVGWVENADATDGEATVTINADGILVIDGKIEVRNAGATVIIDGTSNMFKIAATGSIDTGLVSDGSSAVVSTTLTALFPATTPACMTFLGTSIDGKSNRAAAHSFGAGGTGAMQQRYVALVSGGSVTTPAVVPNQYSYTTSGLDLVGNPVVSLYGINSTGSSLTYYARFYVMIETAI